MSSVSRTRATNLTGLIDIDALVEANLLRQKTKLNTATQKMKVEQYRQEQYREVITKSKTFYNKYCDILSGDSLLSSKNYNTLKFTSSDSSVVSVTATDSKAKIDNYKISIEQLASKANATFEYNALKEKTWNSNESLSMTVTNGDVSETLSFKVADENGTILSEDKIIENYNEAVKAKKQDLNEVINTYKATQSTIDSYKDLEKKIGEIDENVLSSLVPGDQDYEEAQSKLRELEQLKEEKDRMQNDYNNAISNVDVQKNQAEEAEKKLKALNITATKSEFSEGIVFKGTDENDGEFTINGSQLQTPIKGTEKCLKATITNSDGTTYRIDENSHKTYSNEITLDGVNFKFNDITVKKDDDGNVISGTDNPVKVTGKVDGTELKDKIVEFINDYNELLGHINGKLYEEYDRSYLPLTDEDKEGLTDSEIEKLETKAKTGLLRNDSYLRNFADDMKLTMTTMLENSGLSLERIGINPVQDYSTQNGLFTIDEDKLLAAIEENPEEIQELFAGSNGIITKLKDNLSEHAIGTFSRLANKAGVADGVTANTNEMTKDIEQRKKQIANMQTMLKEKEDALYIRYSSLESSLASLQAQQSSLYSYFQ